MNNPVFVFPSRRCNLSCAYCSTSSDPYKPSQTYITSNWKEVVGQINAAGFDELRIAGGEPFLDRTLERAIYEMSKVSLSYTLTTNGTIFPKCGSVVFRHKPSIVWVSLHLHYVKPCRISKTITSLLEKDIAVGLNVFSSQVFDNYRLVMSLCSLGVSRIKVLPISNLGRAMSLSTTLRLGDSFSYSDYVTQLRSIVPNVDVRIELPAIRDAERGRSTCLLKTRSVFAISDSGDVFPCCISMNDPDSFVGNIRREPLKDILTRTKPKTSARLPCQKVLPDVAAERNSCPLSMLTLNEY